MNEEIQNRLYYSLVESATRVDWCELQSRAHDKLRKIEIQLINLIDLGVLKNPVRLYTQGLPVWSSLYLTEAQVQFSKIDNHWICENDYFGLRAIGRSKKQAYENLCKKYKVLKFSKDDA